MSQSYLKNSRIIEEYEDMRLLRAFIHTFFLPDTEPPAVSRAVYMERGFPLSWQSDANTTCGYVVEWHDAFCTRDCPVEWIKVPAGNTNVSIESGKPFLRPPLKKSTKSVKIVFSTFKMYRMYFYSQSP